MTKDEARAQAEHAADLLNQACKLLGIRSEIIVMVRPDKSDPLNETVLLCMREIAYVPK